MCVYIHTYVHTHLIYIVRILFITRCVILPDSARTQWSHRYGACPKGTAGTPPACAQCETGYVPPRLLGALPKPGLGVLYGTFGVLYGTLGNPRVL